jgi:hypothetical protein
MASQEQRQRGRSAMQQTQRAESLRRRLAAQQRRVAGRPVGTTQACRSKPQPGAEQHQQQRQRGQQTGRLADFPQSQALAGNQTLRPTADGTRSS